MSIYLIALAAIMLVAGLAWVVSILVRDVSFVDSLWSLFFLLAAVMFAFDAGDLTPRAQIVLACVLLWSLRLSLHITIRNWGEPEDYRYQKIRENNEPGFVVKSLYIVFGLQAVLAWIIALPLIPAIMNPGGIGLLETAALALWLVGFVFEAGGDYQLSKFKREGFNKARVLDTGLWRYTRHPNYFGDFCIWWAFYLFAVAAGGWWTVLSPLLMSFLLLKVSGVAMLEKTITERRPEYADYIRRTNAFFPGLPKSAVAALGGETR
jgi:steroid 5-alpha reductase family enzyme